MNPGDFTDHYTAWSIEFIDGRYTRIKHEHTGGYVTADGIKENSAVNLQKEKNNDAQLWAIELDESREYFVVKPRANENLVAAVSLFSPNGGNVNWGYLVLRMPNKNEWPNYLFDVR